MKLRALSLYHVGRHNGVVLSELSDGLTVIYGRNEAGKSTLLTGLRAVLFGRTGSMEPASSLGEGARGIAVVEEEEGRQITLERALHATRRNPPRLTCDGQTASGEEKLKEWVSALSVVEELIFHTVFTFQLADLRDFNDARQSLQQRIYTVGLLGGVSPAELEARYRKSALELYNPRRQARKPPLVQCLSEIGELETQLRKAQDTPQAYLDVQAQLTELRKRSEQAERHVEEARVATQRLEKDRVALPVHQEIIVLTEQVRDYDGDARLDGDVWQQVTHWRDLVEQMQTEHAELAHRMTALTQDNERLVIAVPILQAGPTLLELQREHSGAEQRLSQLETRRTDLDAATADMTRIRETLSLHWDDHLLQAVDVSPAAQQQAEAIRDTLNQVEQDSRRHEQDESLSTAAAQEAASGLGQQGLDVDAGAEAVRTRRKAVQVYLRDLADDDDSLLQVKLILQRLNDLADEAATLTARLDSDQAASSAVPSGTRSMPLVVGAAVLALTIILTALQRAWPSSAAASIGLLVFVVLAWTRQGRTPRTRHPSDGAKQAWSSELELVHTRLASTQAERQAVCATLRRVRVDIDDQQTWQAAREQVRRLRAEQEDERDRLEAAEALFGRWLEAQQRAAQARLSREATEAQRMRLIEAWQANLRKQGFSSQTVLDYMPGAFVREANAVLQYRDNRRAMETTRRALADLTAHLHAWLVGVERTVTALSDDVADEWQIAATDDDAVQAQDLAPLQRRFAHWTARLQTAVAQVEEAQDKQRQREDGARKIATLRERAQTIQTALTDVESQLQTVFQSAGVTDWAGFQTWHTRHRARVAQETSLHERQLTIYGMYGGKAAYEQRRSALDEVTLDTLQDAAQRAQAERDRLEQQWDDLKRSVWEAEEKLRVWQDGQTATDLRWQLSLARSDRDALAKQWAAHTLAAAMMKQARDQFEREREPAALRQASAVMARVTQGRYTHVKARLDESGQPQLYLIDTGGEEWRLDRLSRGTREQVYLALRLALVREYAQRGVAMPMVLDDPLVNFDGERLRAYFDIFVEEARQQQMIWLTCHESVLERALAQPEVQVLRLREST